MAEQVEISTVEDAAGNELILGFGRLRGRAIPGCRWRDQPGAGAHHGWRDPVGRPDGGRAERIEDPADRRGRLVRLTPLGEKTVAL